MKWLALDIGGANLKAADGEGFAVSQPFPMWENSPQLVDALRALIAAGAQGHARGRDDDRRAGRLLHHQGRRREVHSQCAVRWPADGKHTRVYLTNGQLVSLQVALKQPLLAAASNWHALARFAGRYVDRGVGLLMDIGSTTCDLIPLVDGQPVTIGKTDTNRMINGELIYTGVSAQPGLCGRSTGALARPQVPGGHEVFATMWDVYLTLGDLPEEPKRSDTADRRPGHQVAARDRLARAICADRETFSEPDAVAMAAALAEHSSRRSRRSSRNSSARLQQPPHTIVLSGQGEFLARRVLEKAKLKASMVSLARELGPELSQCAPAHALAVLAREGSK